MSFLDDISSKFNIKNLDASEISKVLSENQNSLIKLVLIVGSLVLVGMMFNDHHSKEMILRAKISQEKDKIEAVKERDKAVKDLKDFKDSLPKKINESDLITLISNYAKESNVLIASLSPADSKDMGLYDELKISFNGVSDNFRDLMLFLRKIESPNSGLMVDSWSGQEVDKGGIQFSIEISAVILHT